MSDSAPARFSIWRVVKFVALAAMLLTTSFITVPRYRESSIARESRWLAGKANDAYKAKQFDIAGDYYERLVRLAPYDPILNFNLAACRARAGQADDAIAALARAVDCGFVDADVIESAPALASIRTDKRTEVIANTARARRSEEIVVYASPGLNSSAPAPLLIMLHGRGSSPRNFLPAWQSTADLLGLVLAAPRGPAELAVGRYGWEPASPSGNSGLDVRAIERAVDAAIETASRDRQIDTKRIMLVGFSQGGHAALRAFHDHPDRYAGVITFVTVYPPDGFHDWSEAKGKPAVVIEGALDSLGPHSSDARDDLKAAGLEVRYEKIDDMGHEPPLDYGRRQVEAIRFILNR